MKQKIVIQVQMNSPKCRSKALKVAAVTDGVNHVGIEGESKDQVVVIGEQVDSVLLTSNLRKKVGHAIIISIAEVKPPEVPPTEPVKPEPAKPEPESEPVKPCPVLPIQYCYNGYPRFEKYLIIADDDPRPLNCCQM